MKVLTKDDIVAVEDLKNELLEMPEWGKDVCVYVAMMTGAQRDAYEADILIRKGDSVQVNLKQLKLKLVAITLVDDNSHRLFEDLIDKKGDVIETAVEQLGKKSSAAIDRIFAKSQILNRLTKKDVEDLTKNLKATTSEDSVSV